MRALYDRYPFKSPKKFVPVALEHGYSRQEALDFLRSLVHDVKHNPRDYHLPIYSEQSNSFQFDTLVQTRGASPRYFLIVINVNSRKLYAYPMDGKDSAHVLEALMKFKTDVQTINSLTSDEDRAYLDRQTLTFMKDNHVDYRTTSQHDHSRLGIVNRVIRTLRDMNGDRDFTEESMRRCVKAYNDSVHTSTNLKPNEFSKSDELQWIEKMRALSDSRKSTLPIGSHVRTVLPRTMGKRRAALSDHAYVVDSLSGNKLLIRAKDDSVALYPRSQLVKSARNVPLADSIDQGSFGIVKRILGHSIRGGVTRYDVEWQGGTRGTIPQSFLRSGRPVHVTDVEKDYWAGQVRTRPVPNSG